MHLGIDIGTIAVKAALVDGDVTSLLGPVRHEGRPARCLAGLLADIPLDEIVSASVTGAGRRWASEALGIPAVSDLRALSRAFAKLHPQVRTIVEIGGRDSKLIIMRELRQGEEPVAVDASRSSLCAAGTGSFLDQQAARLGFSPEELGSIGMRSEKPANVSGRCSVFAKTDLIHLQQIGASDSDMLGGLCYAVVRNFRSSVAKGRKIERPVAFCGGVALNECVCRATKEIFELEDDELLLPERPEFLPALGCALIAAETSAGKTDGPAFGKDEVGRLEKSASAAAKSRRLPPLAQPSHPAERARHVKPLPEEGKTPVYIGVDIGSISTKAAVIDSDGDVVARRYFWTAGRPLEAVRRAMMEIGGEIGDRVDVRGVGTTGSGRYLVGDFIGADIVKNEITSQAKAAIAHDPDVDTVFEIGGQDSKFIVIKDGTVVDFEMNKVCAAGTGSFLDEQAERMGTEIDGEFSELAFSSEEPVDCGERCTVFMDTDVSNYLASGVSVKDLSGGLAHSIAKNYLTKVADRAKVGERVLFQGAVAFNDSVVAAFEKEIGQKVRVTPDNEITGCIGVALVARDEGVTGTGFRGFEEIAECDYEQSGFTCAKCENRCDVRKVTIEGRPTLFYGDRCDRYQTDRGRKSDLPDLFEERTRWLLEDYVPEPESGPVVGIPLAVAMLELMPYWRTFLRTLGARTVLSSATSHSHIERAANHMTTEVCLPVKAGVGHVLDLVDKKPDFIFLPNLVDRERPSDELIFRYNCPFVHIWGHVARAGIDLAEYGIKVLDPVVFPSLGPRLARDQLERLADSLGVPRERIEPAKEAASAAQEKFYARLRRRGDEILKDIPGGRGVVIVGRPYNAGDAGVNLDLSKKLLKMDVLPIPLDMMPIEKVDVLKRFKNMYWHLGRSILAAASLVADDDRLDMVYVTNFRCGPDSFLTKYIPEALKGLPYLLLEFDDHSADAGVVTRLEAFLDSRGQKVKPGYYDSLSIERTRPHRGLTVYMPHMGDMTYGIAAAARGYDINLQVIPTDHTSLENGLNYSSGKECLPYILCVGNIVRTLHSPDFDRENSAFFMLSSAGSCRLGQYEHAMRRVLDQLGYPDINIISLHQTKGHFGQFISVSFARHCYSGLVAIAELERLVRQIRPFEARPGAVDEVYREYHDKVCAALERKEKPYRVLRQAALRLLEVETVDVDKPVICVVGEGFVRNQPYANCHVARKIEALGGVAVVPTFIEWIRHVNHSMKIFAGETAPLLKRLGHAITRWSMRRIEGKVEAALGPAWRTTHVPSIERVWENAIRADFVPYFGDASLAVGMAIEMAERGADGVINVMPFTCLPGGIARSQLRRASKLMGDMPILDIEFDGRSEDLVRDELEMFMEQAKERHRLGLHKGSTQVGGRADIDRKLRAIFRL